MTNLPRGHNPERDPCRDCGEPPPSDRPGGLCPACWQRRLNPGRERRSVGPTALYRLRDQYGELLYLGTTSDTARRWKEHRKVMPWWPDVDWDRSTIDMLDCGRYDAERIEWAAIAKELPWYNKTHLPEERDGRPWNPRFPDGVPAQPWTLDYRGKAAYRRAWFEWRAILREHLLNPEERAALGRLA
jgi:hypothetical protein